LNLACHLASSAYLLVQLNFNLSLHCEVLLQFAGMALHDLLIANELIVKHRCLLPRKHLNHPDCSLRLFDCLDGWRAWRLQSLLSFCFIGKIADMALHALLIAIQRIVNHRCQV